MTELEKPAWLKAQLDHLPRELAPGRDLWPGIARRLDGPRFNWVPLAVAASILVSAVSALFSWHLYDMRRQETRVALQELQILESPYRAARAVYRKQWPSVRAQLDPATASVIEHNLRIIHQANTELIDELRKHPRNRPLQYLLQQTLAQEMELYQRATDAAHDSI